MAKCFDFVTDIGAAAVIDVRPGDLLVFKLSVIPSPETVARMTRHIQAIVGPDTKILILDRDTSLDVVRQA